MLEATEFFADTADADQRSGVIDDALRSLRIGGSLLLRETYAPPWSIAIPDAERLGTLLGVNSGVRVVAFHLVEFGHCAIKPEGAHEVLLTAGETVVCFGGDAHRLSQGGSSRTQSIETLLGGGRNLRRPDAAGRSAGASLLCGVFLLHHTELNPLFAALPPLMHATLSRPGELHNLAGVARLMAEEIDRKSLGGGYVVERLLEVLCAEAVRAHIEAVPRQETSWFRGIKDPVVGRAIASIHLRPGEDWSVQRLAGDVAMSPSRFAARFSEAVGDSPMAYLAKWRMSLACRQLATTRQSIDQIAASVGYESQAAFSRAFKKHVGVSPAAWRTRERR
ncbi:MAG: AraC family transcriptional regulator [Pseudomonadota bacterium]|nr:AraC family transcriptional regulator [Pseudomonadota bacterium]